MAKTYINGHPVTGSTSYASAVTCVDKDGNISTVQDILDEQNKNITNISTVQDEINELRNEVSEQNKNIEELFQLGVDTKAQIISSLSNSGLGLTSTSTWDEINAALKSFFPSELTLYFNGNTYDDLTGGYSPSGTYTSYNVNNAGKLFFSSYYHSRTAHGYLHTVKPVKIEGKHTTLTAHVTSASQLYSFAWLYVGTAPTTETKSVGIISYSSVASTSISNKNISIDVSSLSGDYYVGVKLQANTDVGEGVEVYIDKITIS